MRLAFVEAGLGNVSAALDLLDEAVELKQWELAFVRTEPWFDGLRGDPRYAALVDRIGFVDDDSAS